MQTEVNILDFVIPFIGGILIFSMLILFIIYFIIIYRRKQVEFEYEKEKAKQLLLKTEIEIKEQTLSHISRELHDNLGQVASLIKINLGMIKPVNDTQISQLSESKELIKQLTQDIKSLSTTLKGENLKRFGLYKMVLKDIDRIKKISNLNIKVTGETNLPKLNPETEVFLYRMIQESFNNVLQHSQAKNVIFNISLSKKLLMFSIKDDGIGFDLSTLKEGNGLINLKERCKIINANVSIESEFNKGTNITISLNYNE